MGSSVCCCYQHHRLVVYYGSKRFLLGDASDSVFGCHCQENNILSCKAPLKTARLLCTPIQLSIADNEAAASLTNLLNAQQAGGIAS